MRLCWSLLAHSVLVIAINNCVSRLNHSCYYVSFRINEYANHCDCMTCVVVNKILTQLGEPIPNLPDYDAEKDEAFDWEPDVRAAIDRLRREKETG